MVGFHVVVGGLGDCKDMRRDFETISAAVRVQDGIGVYAQVSKGIDGHQDVADVCVDFAILETFLQVLVDSLIGDLAQQGEIRDTDFLLLSDLKGRLLDLRLAVAGIL